MYNKKIIADLNKLGFAIFLYSKSLFNQISIYFLKRIFIYKNEFLLKRWEKWYRRQGDKILI